MSQQIATFQNGVVRWRRPKPVVPLPNSAFFYGTLIHPLVLRRVIGHQGSALQIRPVILLVSSAVLCALVRLEKRATP